MITEFCDNIFLSFFCHKQLSVFVLAGKGTHQPISKENTMKTASNSIKGLFTAASFTLAILVAPQTALARAVTGNY